MPTSPQRGAPSPSRARRRLSPSLSGTMSIPPGLTAKAASTGARSTVLRSFLNQASAPGPAIVTSVAPPTGRLSSSAIRQRGSFHRVPAYSSRTGADSATRACAAAGARSAAVTSTGSSSTGSATCWPRSSCARARTIRCSATLRASRRPGCPGTTSTARPRRTSSASTWRWSMSLARPASLNSSAALYTRTGGAISEPKKRVCSRLKPRTGPKPSPSRAADSIAVDQSASTPSVVALIGYSLPPAVKTIGTRATSSDRRWSSVRASLFVSPPTSTPAICTPSAIRTDEPAKARPTSAVRTARSVRETMTQRAIRREERSGTPTRTGVASIRTSRSV